MDFSTVCENLTRRGYKVASFETKEEAKAYILRTVERRIVAFGGSMTLEEMGLYEALGEKNSVIWHWRIPKGASPADVRREAVSADVYISSVNGLSEEGEIVNIDGTCNRVASMLYGHERLILVVGKNKLAKDYDGALYRARNIAAPKNAQRLNMKTPCAVNGDRCFDCKSPERICRALTVLWEKPNGADIEIILVNEDLGY